MLASMIFVLRSLNRALNEAISLDLSYESD